MTGRRQELADAPPPDPRLISLLLFITDRFAWLYRLLGVEYRSMRTLLRVRLILDQRRMQAKDGRIGFSQTGMWFMLCIYAAVGLMLTLPIANSGPFVFMTVALGFTMIMLGLSLFLDFSPTLLDTSDLAYLSAQPISDTTLLAARLTHIAQYLSLIVTSLSVGPLLIGSYTLGVWPLVPVYVASAALSSLLTASFVVLLFLGALRRLDPTRARDALVYFQIAAFAAFYFGIQYGFQGILTSGDWLDQHPFVMALFPPAWYAGALRMTMGQGIAVDGWLIAAGITVPLLACSLLFRVARRRLLTGLETLDKESGKPVARSLRKGWVARLGESVTRTPLERAGCSFFITSSARERSFKLRTYPLLVVLFGPFIMQMTRGRDLWPIEYVPFFVYLLVMWVVMFLVNSRFSDHFEAGWIFDELSQPQLGEFLRGVRKGFLVKCLVLPLAAAVIGCFAMCGLESATDIILAAALSSCVIAIAVPPLGNFMPFTQRYSHQVAQSNMAWMLMLMMLAAGLAAIHALLRAKTQLLGYATPVAAVAAALLILRFLRSRTLIPWPPNRE